MASRFHNVEMRDLVEQIDNEYISPIHKMLLACLASYSDKNGENIYPSTKSLTQITGFHRSTIQKYRQWLVENGYLLIVEQQKNGSNKSSNYCLNIPLINQQQVINQSKSYQKAADNTDRQEDFTYRSQNVVKKPATSVVGSAYHQQRQVPPAVVGSAYHCQRVANKQLDNNEIKKERERETTSHSLTLSPSEEWAARLTKEGLTTDQINKFIAIEQTNPGYLANNFAHYRAKVESGKVPSKSAGLLFRCMAENWANFGQPASTPSQASSAAAVQREPMRQADGSFKTLVTNGDESTREERKAKNEARWQFYLASSEEDRTYWASRVADFDPWIWDVFQVNGFTQDDFITYSANIPDNQLPTFRSLVLRNIDTLTSHQLLGWS